MEEKEGGWSGTSLHDTTFMRTAWADIDYAASATAFGWDAEIGTAWLEWSGRQDSA